MAIIMNSCEKKSGGVVQAKVMKSAVPAISVSIRTTLYDLMAAMQDVIGPGADSRVVATVVHMLSAGYIVLPRDLVLQIREQEGEPALLQ